MVEDILDEPIRQSQAAERLGVSNRTLSQWECDRVYPTWPQQPGVAAYLGYDPFTDPALGRRGANESSGVAFYHSEPQPALVRRSQKASFS